MTFEIVITKFNIGDLHIAGIPDLSLGKEGACYGVAFVKKFEKRITLAYFKYEADAYSYKRRLERFFQDG